MPDLRGRKDHEREQERSGSDCEAEPDEEFDFGSVEEAEGGSAEEAERGHGGSIRRKTPEPADQRGGKSKELRGACPNVSVKVEDVGIDRHFFVQETSSHPVILGKPYITANGMETKVLDNGSAYASVEIDKRCPLEDT